MSPEKDEILSRKFPLLYRERYNTSGRTSMRFGFSCDDGWFNIIYELSEKLEKLIEAEPDWNKPAAFQVKEKFGTLCFYMCSEDNGYPRATDEMYDLIREYTAKAAVTCEVCGQPGDRKNKQTSANIIYSTRILCDQCPDKWD